MGEMETKCKQLNSIGYIIFNAKSPGFEVLVILEFFYFDRTIKSDDCVPQNPQWEELFWDHIKINFKNILIHK